MSNIGASIIFAGMSGAAVADAGGLGTIEIKAMRDAGYDDDFSVGITAASSTIGSIIPPSLPLVIYGVMASASIGELFAAGFIPGLLMRVSLMIMDTIETSAAIFMIVASATIFAWILIDQQVAVILGDALLGFSQNKTVILIIIMMVVLLIGCFMETIAAITILVPVLLPIAEKVGIDPVHLGIIVILNLMLGLLTPPVGMVLYVLSKVSGVKFEKCVIATAPFIVPLLIVLAMITFFPDIAMWLPNVAYRGN